MYNEYFGFKEAPFSIAPDPRYLYMTAQHREALAHLVYGLNSEGGCILLTGEVGTGKTTICRCLLEQIPDQANVALVLNPKVNETELLESICDELHISYPDTDNSLKTYTDRIYNFLIESNRRNEKTVLIIDEAQNLDSKVLEQLRLLTNLETNQRKLLQIIILGQPELLAILAKTEMRQLAQRITARFHLEPLDKNEVKAYISHRLAVAGQSIQLFPENSVKLIYRLSKGIPRLINVICDRALLGAYVENQYAVNPSIVKKAAIEVFGELKNVEKHQRNKRWLYPLVAISGIAIITLITVFYVRTTGNIDLLLQKPGSNEAEKITAITPENLLLKNDASENKTTDINITANNIAAVKTAEKEDAEDSTNLNTDTNPDENVLVTQAANNETNNTDIISDINTTSNDSEYDSLNVIIENAADTPDSAYQKLFNTWQQSFNSNTRLTACKQAEKFALSCLFRQGNINSLKLHNRPAVLTLINNRGNKRYITITEINDDVATIFSNNDEYRIKLQDLEKYWYGQYTLLWNKPEFYSSAVLPGDSGDIINWLKEQLETINNTSSPDIIIGKYDSYLIDKVKAFQSQQGLATDGIVGPVTIIHMNNELDTEAPLLIPSPGQPPIKLPIQSPIKTVTNQS